MARKRTPNGNATAPPYEDMRGSYFLSLSLTNVRCFGEPAQKLDLSDGHGRPARWTVLLGNNGTGKTTILQALACIELVPIMAAGSKGKPTPPNGPPVMTWLPRGMHRRFSDSFSRIWDQTALVRAEVADGGPFAHPTSTFQSVSSEWHVMRGYNTWTTENYDSYERLRCYGYGASRRYSSTTLSPPEGDDPTASLFSDDANLRNAEEWLLRLDYSAGKSSEIQEQQKQRLELVKGMLVEILPEVEAIRFTAPTAARPTPGVEFQTPYGWVGLQQLGHGYRTLVAWMVDFASRLVDRYPDSPNPLAAPAVALVDEIDLHLHPIWQRRLMSYLTKCFPNTQFIVTAHSPLIVQAAAEDANIALLRREGDRVVIDNDVETIRGWRVDQLLTSDLFGLPSARPPQYDDLLERRKQILTKPTLTEKDKQELAELEEKIGPLPIGETAERSKALSLIEETLNLLKAQQGNAQ